MQPVCDHARLTDWIDLASGLAPWSVYFESRVPVQPCDMRNMQSPDFSGTYDIRIFAPPDKVWDWLSRVDLWPTWRQDVSSAYWKKGEGESGVLKWRIRKLIGFTAEVVEWRHQREMRWEAVSYGARFVYGVRLDGDFRSTSVRLHVDGHGGPLRFVPTRAIFVRQVDRSNEIWLGALKTKLEAGKDDWTSPPPGRDNPFENNVKLPSEIGQFER